MIKAYFLKLGGPSVFGAILLLMVFFSSVVVAQDCKGQTAAYYEQNGYTIRNVRIAGRNRTLFDFQGRALNKIFGALLGEQGIPVEKGKPLRALAINKAADFIREKVSILARNTKENFNSTFVLPSIECNSADKSVDVTFFVRLFNEDQYEKIQNTADRVKELKQRAEQVRTEAIKDQEKLSDRLELIAQDAYLTAQDELEKAQLNGDAEKIQKLMKTVETTRSVYKAVRKGYRTIKFINNFRVYPFASDEDSGSVNFGITANIRVFPRNPVLERFVTKWRLGNTSTETALYFKGDKKTDNTFFRHNEWSFGYIYDRNTLTRDDTDLINANRQREFFSYAGSTKKLGKSDLIFNYGFEFDRVNQLKGGVSDGVILVENINRDTENSNVRFNNIKLAFGIDTKIRNVTLNASYGLQFSNAISLEMDDFKKHLVDVDTSIDLPQNFRTKINFGYGKIDAYGNKMVPIVERFYGSVDYNSFIVNGWRINGSPMVRSVNAYEFASALGTNYYGGDQFISVNSTTYIPIWHKNPFEKTLNNLNARGEEVKDTFLNAEKEEIEENRESLRRLYLNSLPLIIQFKTKLQTVKNDIEDIRQTLKEMVNAVKEPQLKEKLKSAVDVKSLRVINGLELLIGIFRSDESVGDRFKHIIGEAIRNDSLLQELKADLNSISTDTKALKINVPNGTGEKAVQAIMERLDNQLEILQKTADEARSQFAEVREYITKTAIPNTLKTIVSPAKLHRYFVRNTDAVNVDGVVLFDMGRIKQNGTSSPWKSGLGGGIKIHYFFVNLSSGYIWNLNRDQNEGAGRFIFSIDFADLFD
ncbi:MAG: hypothetical protein ACK5NT_08750 [Pyrinomonadaceae bacterium]